MHASSLENMQKCYARFVEGNRFEKQVRVSVLDVGGADINGSYRDVFAHPRFAFTAVDLSANEGVHLVLDDPYRIPVDDQSIDIVLSGQMLEHCEFFWLMFREMVRVLRPGGYIFLIAPSAGPEHRYPIDCYRFYPDAYRALARYANCELVEVWRDERGPWKDLVGVFQRHGSPPTAALRPLRLEIDPQAIAPGTKEEERISGEVSYLDVLVALHRAIQPKCYLEIGVRHGVSLGLAHGPAIGVDPKPNLQQALPETTRVFEQTSDEFFDSTARQALPAPVDLAFIDGLHLFEAALRDFMNIERLAAPGALILIDDIFPNHPSQATRERRTRVWTGDVWKLIQVLRRWRPDLAIACLDTSPCGCLLVGGLDPANTTFRDAYNPIVRMAWGLGDPPAEILGRQGAVSPSSAAYTDFMAALPETAGDPARRKDVLRRLVASTSKGRSA